MCPYSPRRESPAVSQADCIVIASTKLERLITVANVISVADASLDGRIIMRSEGHGLVLPGAINRYNDQHQIALIRRAKLGLGQPVDAPA